jgi:hypothetical protein
MPFKRKAHYRVLPTGRITRVKAAKTNKPYTGTKIASLRRGSLTQFGYSAYSSTKSRRVALQKAVKAYGPLPVFRKLGAVMVLQKRRTPEISEIYMLNRNYVKKFMSSP